MAARVETGQSETLSPAELGAKTHEAITSLVTNLLAIPELMTSLGQKFFGRTSSGEGNTIDYVYFQKGKYGYSVDWHGSPLRYGPEKVRDYQGNLRLGVEKFDLSKEGEDFDSKKIATMCLSSYFIEDQNGDIKEFTNGYAILDEDFEPNWPDIRRPKPANTFKDAVALDRIPQTFSDLYPSVKL